MFSFRIPHSKVGREGIEPLAATSIIKGAWFTARHEGHDPVWNAECGIGNAEHWFTHIYSELRIRISPFDKVVGEGFEPSCPYGPAV